MSMWRSEILYLRNRALFRKSFPTLHILGSHLLPKGDELALNVADTENKDDNNQFQF